MSQHKRSIADFPTYYVPVSEQGETVAFPFFQMGPKGMVGPGTEAEVATWLEQDQEDLFYEEKLTEEFWLEFNKIVKNTIAPRCLNSAFGIELWEYCVGGKWYWVVYEPGGKAHEFGHSGDANELFLQLVKKIAGEIEGGATAGAMRPK